MDRIYTATEQAKIKALAQKMSHEELTEAWIDALEELRAVSYELAQCEDKEQ